MHHEDAEYQAWPEPIGGRRTEAGGGKVTLKVKLVQDRPLMPDVNFGAKDFSGCNSGAKTGDWGVPGVKATFFNEVTDTGGANVSASSYAVSY
jgi:hypothetical protein